MSFSPGRWIGIIVKEFIQLQRDRLTFGMMVGIPLIQLLLFGFAINSDPKHLATAVLVENKGGAGGMIATQQSDLADRKSDEWGRRAPARGDLGGRRSSNELQ